ncbi:MAG: aspartate dehydrogenase [Thermoplasmatota archaeon]
MKVGIIGCGAIGSEVAKAAKEMGAETYVSDVDPDAVSVVAKGGIHASTSEAMLDSCDLLVECANKGVVQTHVLEALRRGKKAMILTVGALADGPLLERLETAARENGGKLYVPSGAVMGVDGIKAAKEAGLKAVTLVTTKPNEGLDRKVDKWTLLFNGPAREAVAAFPKNVNVAATLSMAGLGFDETWVQVAVDPLATRNSHKVILEGDFGRARIEVENMPSPQNPRTSYLAALSAIALLRRILSPIEIGA